MLALAGSAFVVLAAEPLYLLVDTAVVGHLGTDQLGGLGIAASLMGVLLLIGTFVEYGTTGRAARFFGAGDRARAVNEGVQASWLALGIGLALVLVGQVGAGFATRLLAGSDTVAQHAALQWLRVGLFGLPGVLLVLAGNGWMRGVQQTSAPVRIVLGANALSAALSPVLVHLAGLGLRGSAVANVCAQALGAALFVRALLLSTTDRSPQWSVMRRQLVVGRDLVLRSLGFEVAFVTAAAVAARMGSAQLAAHQIGLQLWTFVALMLDAFAIAAQSVVGAALGGGSPAAARHAARVVARYGLYAGIGVAVVLAAGFDVIPAIFTSSGAVRQQSHVLWPWLVLMMPLAGVVFALDGVLLGAGDVAFMRTVTLMGAVGVFTPINLLALHFGWGLTGVWAGLTGFIVVRTLAGILRCRGNSWISLGAD